MKIEKIIKYDLIYFDPPWGGSDYKNTDNLNLYLNNINMNNIIESLYNYCNIIILKVPNNYNINHKSLWKIHVNYIYKGDNKSISFKLIIFNKIK